MPSSTAIDQLRHHLETLVAELGATTRATFAATHWSFAATASGDTPTPAIVLDLSSDAVAVTVTVTVGPWSSSYGLDDDDDAELVAELVAALLFGDVRVEHQAWGSGRSRSRLQIRHPHGWEGLAWQGRHIWWPWTRPHCEVFSHTVPRPRSRPIQRVVAPPWAPWAGLGGFIRRQRTPPATVDVPDGVLDLHPVPPKQVKDLVLAYIDACHDHGVLELRIIHGKGIGNLRRTVHAVLDGHARVASFRLGGHGEGSWGATLVQLVADEVASNGSVRGGTDE